MNIKGFLADHFGCGYYRMKLPASEIVKHGHTFTLQDAITATDFGGEADIYLLQRQYQIKPLAGYFQARTRGAAMVWEIDDWVWNIDKSNPCAEEYARPEVREGIEKYMVLCDAVTTTTPYIAKMFERWMEPERIFVLPNCLDFDGVWGRHLAYREANKVQDGLIRIGWHGSSTHLQDFKQVVKPIVKLLKEFKKLRLVITGWEAHMYFQEFQSVLKQIEYNPWGEPDTFGRNLANVDIGIAPLIYTTFNRAKSAIKHYEYSALKIPTVATWIEPYYDVKANGGISIEGTNEAAWYRELRGLIESKQRRLDIGAEGYRNVKAKNDITTQWPKWIEAYETIKIIREERPLELWVETPDGEKRQVVMSDKVPSEVFENGAA